MSPITQSMQVSLDGRIAGPNGELDWPIVGDELLGSFDDAVRDAATFLYGRRMYEEMAEFWPTGDTGPDAGPAMIEYIRIWRAAPKIVVSDTLRESGWNSRIVRGADLATAVGALRAQDGSRHILYGGAQPIAALMAANLIDEYWLYVHPIVLGGGPRLLADMDHRLDLRLVGLESFPGGVEHLRCATR